MVCQPPCCLAVGPRPFPCDPVRRCVTRSGKSSNILPFPPFFFVAFAASCTLFPSGQASVASLASVGPLLGGASESGVAARIRGFSQCCFLWLSLPLGVGRRHIACILLAYVVAASERRAFWKKKVKTNIKRTCSKQNQHSICSWCFLNYE